MRKHFSKSILKKIAKIVIYISGSIFMLLLLFIISIYLGFWGALPQNAELKELSQYQASEIYDVNNKLMGKFYLKDRQPIKYSELPEHLIKALLATEDERFYKHSGIDTKSLFRVMFKTILLQDSKSGGGSTLTQQLAKNLFSRKDYGIFTVPVVKTKEMIVAKRLEKIYTKNQIIELYLNTVPFSGNTYGIESASLKHFNKKTKDLTITEASTLVGTLKATTTYNPFRYAEKSKARRNVVLYKMYQNDFLSKKKYNKLKKDSLILDYGKYDNETGTAAYFREELRKKMLDWCEKNSTKSKSYNLYTSGLKIYTTLDLTLQEFAEEAAVEHLSKLQKQLEKEYGKNAPWNKNKKLVRSIAKKTISFKSMVKQNIPEDSIYKKLDEKRKMELWDYAGNIKTSASSLDSISHYLKFLNTGMVSLDPTSGALKTWIGGANFEYFKFDHVNQSKRQVGSTFKPIVYTTALEQGVSPCDYFSAAEVAYQNMKGWSPSNSGNVDEKYMNFSMQYALSRSINTVSVKVLEKAGIKNTLAIAKKMGISSKLPEVPSLALGTAEINVLELAGAYASYANKSKPVKPYYLLKIENNKGKLLEKFKNEQPEEPAFSENTRQIMLEMMRMVVNEGTAKRLRNSYNLSNDIVGKTGTTQSNKDAWFVGLTPKLLMVTWVGHDDHRIGFRTTSIGQGANAALPISAGLLRRINADPQYSAVSNARFEKPSAEVRNSLDCPPTKRDGFLKRLFSNPDKKKKRNFKGRN